MTHQTSRGDAPLFSERRVATASPAPVFDVVVPTLNRPAARDRAIASLLNQTLAPGRVIVVGSPLPACDSALVVPVEIAPPFTAGFARNAGLHRVDAPYVGFLDDDDEWTTGFASAALAILKADPGLAFAVGPIVRIDDANGRALRPRDFPEILSPRGLLSRNPGFTGSNVIYRRSALTEVGGFDPELRVANDLDLLIRLIRHGAAYRVLPETGIHQHIHAGAQLTKPTPERLKAVMDFERKHRAHMTYTQRVNWFRRRLRIRAAIERRQPLAIAHRVLELALAVLFEPLSLGHRFHERRVLRGGGYRQARPQP